MIIAEIPIIAISPAIPVISVIIGISGILSEIAVVAINPAVPVITVVNIAVIIPSITGIVSHFSRASGRIIVKTGIRFFSVTDTVDSGS